MRHLALALIFAVSSAVYAIPTEGHKLMIAAASPYAVEAGRKVAARGGNVVDVAVAVELAMAVTSPYFAALGGGGFALVKMQGQDARALDFRETAPAATGKDYFAKLDKRASIHGGTAVAVPGVPAGLWALHKKYGKLKWATLFADAMSLAKQGFAVSGEFVWRTREEREHITAAGTKAFYHFGVPLRPGEVLKQPDLARALTALRDHGPDGFYKGAVAEDMVSAVKEAGGAMTAKDLAAYKVRWLDPLVTQYEGRKIYLMPPPSSGGVVIFSALHLMNKLNLKATAPLSVDEYHMLAEIESRAFRGRVLLGDPDFYKNPLALLTSEKYLDTLAASIDPKKAVAMEPLSEDAPEEKTETTHFSVMDADGNAVAFTVTLNGNFGSGVVSPKFGIALNDEMDDFTTHPGEANMFGLIQGRGNDVEPGKRPLSSMSPTLVEKNGKIEMALGAPGGPRIVTAVLQALFRVLARGTDIDVAIQSPRVHHQFLPDFVYVDKGRFTPETLDGLKARGHKIENSTGMGKVYIVRLRPDGMLEAAFDARGEGAAGGI